jgi:hypothetical protein
MMLGRQCRDRHWPSGEKIAGRLRNKTQGQPFCGIAKTATKVAFSSRVRCIMLPAN